MLKGFKEFILRGNVVELAVAFVIGAAFATMVDTFVSAIITPLLAAVAPNSADGLGFHLISGNEDTFINIGVLIDAVIVFLLTALLIYFVLVVPMNKVKDRREARRRAKNGEPEEEPIAPTDTELLTEIRDLLKAQQPK